MAHAPGMHSLLVACLRSLLVACLHSLLVACLHSLLVACLHSLLVACLHPSTFSSVLPWALVNRTLIGALHCIALGSPSLTYMYLARRSDDAASDDDAACTPTKVLGTKCAPGGAVWLGASLAVDGKSRAEVIRIEVRGGHGTSRS